MNNNTLKLDFPIHSPRLSLRPFQPDDITEEYLQWLNDTDLMRYSNQRFFSHTKASCLNYLQTFTNTPNHFLSLRHSHSGKAIGTMTLYFLPQHGTVDIGILVGDKGKGFAQEAWQLMMTHLSVLSNVRKISAGTLACHHRMIRVIENSGMVLEGRRIGHEIVEGKAIDILYFGSFCHV